MEKQFVALAYYLFTKLENPHLEVTRHKQFFKEKDCSSRIYISEQGINGQMSAEVSDAEAYMTWIKSDIRFQKISFKIHEVQEHIFPRLTVKYRSQLVALDEAVNAEEGGVHVSSTEWKKMLESGEYLVLDVRNRYEWEIGHFEGAVLPPLETFREFPKFAEHLSKEVDAKSTKVMMYCTGGIRCELYSALLKKKGFDEVYQLQGGVIQYGLEEGAAHWRGKLFVFDDRLAVPIDGKECAPIAYCLHCQLSCDIYYNCANMDCNELFICCTCCLETYKGCCSYGCTTSSRLRPLDKRQGNKPFRKKHACAVSARELSFESQEL